MSDMFYFNGRNGDTGDYLFEPATHKQVANCARGNRESNGSNSDWLNRILKSLKAPFQGLPMDVDPTDVSQAGWGIVFHENASPQLREAMQPLIDHRLTQIPEERCKVLEYKSGQGMKDWLRSQGVHVGSVAPTKVPYYLLLVGDPTDIPFAFQCLLDIEYSVGRLSFDDVEQYHTYATSVIRYENSEFVSTGKEVAYWGVRHDKGTEMSADHLISPLYKGDEDLGQPIAEKMAFDSKCLIASEATRANLLNLLKEKPPTMLCTASHGLGWKHGQVDPQRQRQENGALFSQDWPGEGDVSMDHYVTGQDFSDDLHVHGMVAFLFACYGAGTPKMNYFVKPGAEAEVVSERPFVSAIPQRLLGHPNGSALAVLGHFDMAWSYSFKPSKIGQQVQPFRNMIGRIISGEPIGHSTKDFSERYASLSSELLSAMDKSQAQAELSAKKLARLWIERNDAQNYVLLGDPAAKVRVDAFKNGSPNGSNHGQSRTIQVKSDPDKPTMAANLKATRSEKKVVAKAKAALVAKADPVAKTDPIAKAPSLEYAAPPSVAVVETFNSLDEPEAGKFLMGTLRALRAEAQNLTSSIQTVLEIDMQSENAEELIKAGCERVSAAKNRSLANIGELRTRACRLARENASICDWCSDEVTHIKNHWGSVLDGWPHQQLDVKTQISRLRELSDSLRAIILLCGKLTVTSRIDQHLSTLRIGQAFDYHKTFEDELPDEADRKHVLDMIASHPDSVSGVVDASAGVIYRMSREPDRRLLSYGMIAGMTFCGFGLIALATWLEIWPEAVDGKTLYGTYLFLLLGALVHVLVSAIKEARDKSSAGLVAVEDWLLWMHVREASILMSIVYLWIGLFGIAFLFEPATSWQTAFFVGYSIDNFVDLFLERFSKRASKEATKEVTTLSSAT